MVLSLDWSGPGQQIQEDMRVSEARRLEGRKPRSQIDCTRAEGLVTGKSQKAKRPLAKSKCDLGLTIEEDSLSPAHEATSPPQKSKRAIKYQKAFEEPVSTSEAPCETAKPEPLKAEEKQEPA